MLLNNGFFSNRKKIFETVSSKKRIKGFSKTVLDTTIIRLIIQFENCLSVFIPQIMAKIVCIVFHNFIAFQFLLKKINCMNSRDMRQCMQLKFQNCWHFHNIPHRRIARTALCLNCNSSEESMLHKALAQQAVHTQQIEVGQLKKKEFGGFLIVNSNHF